MKYGIIDIATVPVRKYPQIESEMITQLLFGEHFSIVEEIPQWLCIENTFLGYTGWVSSNRIVILSHKDYVKLCESPTTSVTTLIKTTVWNTSQYSHLPFAASLPFWDPKTQCCYINDKKFQLNGDVITYNNVIEPAQLFINAPYLWGGRTFMGVDCSGLTQLVYKIFNKYLPHNASQQEQMGTLVKGFNNIQQGDLAFFNNEKNRIDHVGIIATGNSIIHASGKVKVERLDEKGIFNEELQTYTHKLYSVKRLMPLHN